MPEAGRYERGGELGWGGMGRVIAAHDRRLGRDVALKEVVTRAVAGSEASRRLAREAAITAALDHPAIVPVFDAGVGENGQPYYTMRLIRGRTLTQAIADANTLADRLGLLRHFLDVCEAIAFAHSLGVIHRDLKPDNVMVGEFGETQVMDWGLARAPDSADEAASGALSGPGQTQLGSVIGTPAYMSPEQARGEPADLRSDVWSLGVVLRELLTGATPFAGMEAEAVLAAVGAGTLPPAGPAMGDAPDELVAISERALQRSPEQRYPSARQLAEDVARYIDGRLVDAHRYTPLDHLRRLVRAWRAPLAVGLVAAVGLSVIAVLAFQRNTAERKRATAAERETATALELADTRLGRSLASHAVRAFDLGAWPEAEVLAAHSLDLIEDPRARGVLAGVTSVARETKREDAPLPECRRLALSPDGTLLLCGDSGRLTLWARGEATPRWSTPGDARWAEFDPAGEVVHLSLGSWLTRRSLRDGRSLLVVPRTHGGGVLLAAGAPDEATIAVVDSRLVRVTDADGDISSTNPCGDGDITAAESNRDSFLLACDGGVLLETLWSGEIHRRWDALDGLSRDFLQAIAPDGAGARLLVGSELGLVNVIDLAEDRVTSSIDTDDDPIVGVRWLAGDRAVVTTERSGARIWSPGTGLWVQSFPRQGSTSVGLDGHGLVTLGDTWTRWSFDVAGAVPGVMRGEGMTASRIAPDGQTLVTTHGGGQIEVWDLPMGHPRASLSWQDAVVKDGAFSRDGSRFLAGTVFEGLRWFETAGWTPRTGPSDRQGVARRIVSLKNGFLAVQYSVRHLQWLGLDPTRMRQLPLGDAGELHDASARIDGAGAVLLGPEGILRWLDDGATVLRSLPPSPAARTVATTHNSARIVLAGAGEVWMADRDSGEELQRYQGAEGTVLEVAVSPDDRWVAAGTLEGAVQLWDLENGAPVLSLDLHDRRVVGLDFEPNGQALWTASWDGSARRIDLTDLLTPPGSLVARAEALWGLTVEQALVARSR